MRRPAEDRPVWLDGQRVAAGAAVVPVTDEAFLAGAGLFETLAVRGGTALDVRAHLDRLARGAERLSAGLPPREELNRVIALAAAEEHAPCGWLKVVLTRGGSWCVFGGAMDPEEEGRPATAVLLPWRRSLRDPLTAFKSLNYAGNLLGLEQARQRGADEGLWLNSRGHLAEGCTSNLFVIQGRKLFTPAERDGILPGVVRALVLRAARSCGLPVYEGKLRLKRLLQADEAFLTSSLRGVQPLVGFEGRPVGRGRPGPICVSLASRVASTRLGG